MATTDFVMPKLGLTMTEGTVARWQATPGRRFETGDVVVVVETDKIACDVEAPGPGILREVLAVEGSVVPVGTPIGRWDVADIEASIELPTTQTTTASAAPVALEATRLSPGSDRPTAAAPRGEHARTLATPFARRLAREAGIDLRQIDGSGPRGRVKAADVNRAIATRRSQPAPAAAATATTPAPAHPAATYSAGIETDVTALLKLNDQINDAMPELHVEFVHYVVLAAAKALDLFAAAAIIGLAPKPDDEGGTARVMTRQACTTLRSTVVLAASPATMPDADSLPRALWIERALDGIAFASATPPDGWPAAITVGSARDSFRPDSDGRAVRAATVSLVLTCRAGAIDSLSAQRLLRHIRMLIEAPLLLLAS